MLNWNTVLDYVKGNLSLPSTFIEMTDDQIIDWSKKFALVEFSQTHPDTNIVSIIVDNSNYIHPSIRGQYFIPDEENLPIIGIKECLFKNNFVLEGHPIMPAFSFEQLKYFGIASLKSRMLHPYSMFDRHYKFVTPNIVNVDWSGGTAEDFLVEYERVQPEDLRNIPTAMNMIFMDLCLAHVMIKIGNMRSAYTDINTPHGQIPLNADLFRTRGEELRKEVVEKLIEDSMPPITIEIY